jgi:hypothetical protein
MSAQREEYLHWVGDFAPDGAFAGGTPALPGKSLAGDIVKGFCPTRMKARGSDLAPSLLG